MEHTDSFGYWLRRWRKALDLTQSAFAQQVGCSVALIQKIETDARRPSRQIARRMADVLGVSAAEQTAFMQAARAERGVSRLVLPNQPLDHPQPGEPLRALRRTNLPAQLTQLIGREHELTAVTAYLRETDTRLVTLTGPGGVGKTHLGISVAAALHDSFCDGVYMVDLAPLHDPALVSAAIAQALEIGLAGEPFLERLKEALRDQELLLLLDNVEHLLDATPQVAKLLSATGKVKILATSRERLRLRGEQEIVVEPLAVPDPAALPAGALLAQWAAVRLFIARAQAVYPDFAPTEGDYAAIAAICARLDGLPLAIELVATQVKILPPKLLLARLNTDLMLFTSGPRDLPARQQTVYTTIAWSYRLLNAEEQALLRSLSVFVGGCTLAAIEAVALPPVTAEHATVGPPSTLRLVAALVEKSLLRREALPDGAVRFTLLETIRAFALDQVAACSEHAELRRRHALYFLTYAEEQFSLEGPHYQAWVARFRREYANMWAALEWSQTTEGDAEVSLRLVNALSGLWWNRGIRHEAIAAVERSLNHPHGIGRTKAQMIARIELAGLFALTGNYPGAEQEFAYALELARELGERAYQAECLERLGWLAREQGDSSTALPYLCESLAIFRALDNPFWIAGTLNTLAGVAILEEDAARAEALLNESRVMAQRAEWWDIPLGWALNHLGHAAQLRGEFAQALAYHEESLGFFCDGYQAGEVEAYQCLGACHLGLGQIAAGLHWLQRGLALSLEVRHQAGIAWCLAGIGSAAALAGQPERAARLWGAAERLRQSIGCRSAPATRATYEQAIGRARSHLGPDAFAAAWAVGQAMPLRDALREARDEALG
jgi:predicted ATPase/transcriptional regulator with XRE-family HTH domain